MHALDVLVVTADLMKANIGKYATTITSLVYIAALSVTPATQNFTSHDAHSQLFSTISNAMMLIKSLNTA